MEWNYDNSQITYTVSTSARYIKVHTLDESHVNGCDMFPGEHSLHGKLQPAHEAGIFKKEVLQSSPGSSCGYPAETGPKGE